MLQSVRGCSEGCSEEAGKVLVRVSVFANAKKMVVHFCFRCASCTCTGRRLVMQKSSRITAPGA